VIFCDITGFQRRGFIQIISETVEKGIGYGQQTDIIRLYMFLTINIVVAG
jgi:hypothetical protein